MKIITAMVQPFMLDKITDALEAMEGFPGMTVTDVRGFGRRGGTENANAPFDVFVEKVRMEIVARDEMVERIVETIVRFAHTGNRGDGKVFVWPVESAVCIRTGESDDKAL
jgi:nitrogen regulatory protein PII